VQERIKIQSMVSTECVSLLDHCIPLVKICELNRCMLGTICSAGLLGGLCLFTGTLVLKTSGPLPLLASPRVQAVLGISEGNEQLCRDEEDS
jgi:hypothetical protein